MTGAVWCLVPHRLRKSVQGLKGCSLPAPGGTGSELRHYESAGRTYFAAMVFAVSESGPGCGTKTASR